MITVKLFGGAKRSFLTDKLEVEKDEITVAGLLEYLQRSIPTNLPMLDIKNILVAVNGVDLSALGGSDTGLKDGDVLSIIPVVHGGSTKRISFRCGTNVELIRLRKINYDPINFLETLRKQYPDLLIQGVQSKHIVSVKHAKKVVSISLAARRANVLLSNKIETDILMRFAFTRQINDAIKKIGLQKGQDSILIVIGKKSSISRLFNEIKHLIQPFATLSNSNFMKKKYLITNKQLECIISKNPLEDFLSERSAVLFH
jgi:tRNA threonylcarbamoyladenosine modification (KEOPS) complex Cgi121 subunit/molybdopterin converting factor small subunit